LIINVYAIQILIIAKAFLFYWGCRVHIQILFQFYCIFLLFYHRSCQRNIISNE